MPTSPLNTSVDICLGMGALAPLTYSFQFWISVQTRLSNTQTYDPILRSAHRHSHPYSRRKWAESARMRNRGQAMQLVARSLKCAKTLRTFHVYSARTSRRHCKSQGTTMGVSPEKSRVLPPRARKQRYVDLYYLGNVSAWGISSAAFLPRTLQHASDICTPYYAFAA